MEFKKFKQPNNLLIDHVKCAPIGTEQSMSLLSTIITTDMLNEMVSMIMSSSDELHFEIYKLLRLNGVSKTFFSVQKRHTYFDISKLQTDVKLALYNFIMLTKEKHKRDIIILSATKEHNMHIAKLDEHLQSQRKADKSPTVQHKIKINIHKKT